MLSFILTMQLHETAAVSNVGLALLMPSWIVSAFTIHSNCECPAQGQRDTHDKLNHFKALCDDKNLASGQSLDEMMR